MIIPHGYDLYYYDINSLYPYTMMTESVPVGNVKAFTGNILNINPDAFGFFECEIITPKKLNIPVLQFHNKNKTISPLGRFKGWFFSFRINFRYSISILVINFSEFRIFHIKYIHLTFSIL